MPLRELPARPNLDNLKKQAKSLLDAAQARDRDALGRFAILPALAGKSAGRRSPPATWRCTTRSRSSHVNTASRRGTRCARKSSRARCRSTPPSRNSSAARLVARRAARTGCSRSIRASPPQRCRRRWCSETPRAVERPARAIIRRSRPQPGGPHELGAAALRVPHVHARRRPRRVSTGSSRLRGASARWARTPTPSITGTGIPSCRGRRCGARCAPSSTCRSRKCCLQAGANPTDGVTSHIAGGGGNLDALELLHRYGLNVNGIPGGVPPLVHMMLWSDTPAGPRWLLDHGADANLPWGDDGEAPLHVAARRWDVADGRDARRARRRRLAPARRRRHAAHAGRAARQPRHRALAAGARRRRRAVAARSLRRGLRARRPSGGRRAAGRPPDAPHTSCGPSTTSCFTVRPRAATPLCSRRCSRAGSIRTRRTRTRSRRCIARRWAATPRRCACCSQHGADVNARRRDVRGVAARVGC